MKKTAKGLVEYALAQLGRPYWYGTFGQAASKELYDQKKNQYPKQYTWDYDGTTAKVHDCVGLIKGYLWGNGPEDVNPVYDPAQDLSANMMHAACETAGQINTMPDVSGVLVFKDKHVGVYIGGGEVIEARGHSYGVVKTKLADRPWTSWGYCPYIIYEELEQEKNLTTTVSVDLPILRKGDKSETVRAMQNLLLAAGYEMKTGNTIFGADASYGGATCRTVERFQTENGLAVTGECGLHTWSKLLNL